MHCTVGRRIVAPRHLYGQPTIYAAHSSFDRFAASHHAHGRDWSVCGPRQQDASLCLCTALRGQKLVNQTSRRAVPNRGIDVERQSPEPRGPTLHRLRARRRTTVARTVFCLGSHVSIGQEPT